MKMFKRLFECLLVVLVLAPFGAQAAAEEWRGSYTYPDGRRSVPFVLTLSGSQGAVTGRTTEPNTFGNKSASQLFGNVRGTISGSSVSFTKTYDGTGGVNHSVAYSGTISGNSMSGRWVIGNTSGSFSATRVGGAQASPCDRCERFRGQAEVCNSCCHCQQTNNTNACRSQTNPDNFTACLNRANRSREACNVGCFGR
ncbi:MAG: hypothetical protein FJX62_06720 [Alphaproteobacteria bacterium]|nr:hypothetical protein [Alphaproteobacteria bacterium]